MFDCLRQFVVIVNPTKCELGVSELTFLGQCLNSQGIYPLQDKVKVIQEFPQPTTKHKLREFFGLINFLSSLHLTLCWNIATSSQFTYLCSQKLESSMDWTVITIFFKNQTTDYRCFTPHISGTVSTVMWFILCNPHMDANHQTSLAPCVVVMPNC